MTAKTRQAIIALVLGCTTEGKDKSGLLKTPHTEHRTQTILAGSNLKASNQKSLFHGIQSTTQAGEINN